MKILRTSFLALILGTAGTAAPITPLSYSFNMSPGYGDDTGSQLTDDAYADLIPNVSLTGYEWVGWDGGTPVVTFNFGSVVTINQVTLSMANWTAAAVYLPETVKIGAEAFSVNPAAYPTLNHALLSFAGGWTGSSLTLELSSSHSRWIFLDEVKFNEGPAAGTGNAVPDTATALPLFGAAVAALVAARRRLL